MAPSHCVFLPIENTTGPQGPGCILALHGSQAGDVLSLSVPGFCKGYYGLVTSCHLPFVIYLVTVPSFKMM